MIGRFVAIILPLWLLTACALYQPASGNKILYHTFVTDTDPKVTRVDFKIIMRFSGYRWCKDYNRHVVCGGQSGGLRSIGRFEDGRLREWWQERDGL